jgi:hypothetical protein
MATSAAAHLSAFVYPLRRVTSSAFLLQLDTCLMFPFLVLSACSVSLSPDLLLCILPVLRAIAYFLSGRMFLPWFQTV